MAKYIRKQNGYDTKPIKYTEDFCEKEVKNILDEILKNEKIILLGKIFEKKEYSYTRLDEWVLKYKNNQKISSAYKKIKEILETRVNDEGLHFKVNVAMAIFNLKNNYGWKDKTEQDLTLKIPKPILENLIKKKINDNYDSDKKNSEIESED